jgi:hypothetical protein
VLKAAMAYSHLTTAFSCLFCDRLSTSRGPNTEASTCNSSTPSAAVSLEVVA